MTNQDIANTISEVMDSLSKVRKEQDEVTFKALWECFPQENIRKSLKEKGLPKRVYASNNMGFMSILSNFGITVIHSDLLEGHTVMFDWGEYSFTDPSYIPPFTIESEKFPLFYHGRNKSITGSHELP
jgi:hypothetical protein